jgi:hypothetical protein
MLSILAPTYKSEQALSLMEVNDPDLKAQMRDKHRAGVFSIASQKFKLHQIVENLSRTVTICIYFSQ